MDGDFGETRRVDKYLNSNTGRFVRSSEQLNFGSALPTWWGGFFNEFTYKKLKLSFLIDFKLGHKLISETQYERIPTRAG